MVGPQEKKKHDAAAAERGLENKEREYLMRKQHDTEKRELERKAAEAAAAR